MLSLARGNAAGRCIRCAIRSQRLSLQQARLASYSRRRREDGRSQGFEIRYTGGQRTDKTSRRDGALRERFNKSGDRDKGGAGRGKKNFPEMLQERLQAMKEELKDAPIVEYYLKERREAGDNKQDFGKLWNSFTKDTRVDAERLDKPFFGGGKSGSSKHEKLVEDWRLAFSTKGQRGLDARIKYSFYSHVTGARFTESDIKNQKGLADLRYPTEWYPGTRAMHRTIHLHVGPTNSGKTYHALQRLEQAQSGVYAGPLRLLAHEVYTRMKAKGKNCALITGEERRVPEMKDAENPEQFITSCTVEMMMLNTTLDVAVIDEIQMIGSSERGWAWTQALLGVRAREVHLCGEERTVPLIKALCASVGEKLVIHNYTRLSPLKIADESLNGKIEDLRKGDCVVSFSVMGIHALRRQIERATGRKVATVYGSLPPAKSEDGSVERRVNLNVYPSPIRVAYATVREMMPQILDEYAATHNGQRPDLILHIGIASPRPYYSVESLAHRDDYVITDVDGEKGFEQGEKRWREMGLPPILAPGLATENDVKNAGRSGSQKVMPYPPDEHFLHVWKANAPRFLDLRISRDPGHYLCDFIFYTSLALAKMQGADRSVLFLHVPGGAADHDIERGREVALALIKTMVTCWIDDKRKDLA